MSKVKLNVYKTKYLVFSYKGIIDLSSVIIDQSEIEHVKHVKYLGLYIDYNLRFDEHINRVSSKIARSLGVMNRIEELVPVSISKILYFSLIYPYFNYCIEIWGSTSQYHINKLVLLQKRAVRIVKDVHFLHHTDELFNEMKLLRLNDIYKFNIGLYMYKSLRYVDYDDDLCNYVNGNMNRHSYSIRNTDAIVLPRYRCESSKCEITCVASEFWNHLPIELKNSESVKNFKKALKSLLSS